MLHVQYVLMNSGKEPCWCQLEEKYTLLFCLVESCVEFIIDFQIEDICLNIYQSLICYYLDVITQGRSDLQDKSKNTDVRHVRQL